MHPPPLLLSRPFGAQVALAIVVPALFGALTGYLLGVSEPAYLVLSILGIGGGVVAGFEHSGAGEGALRGVVGGSLFGTFILFMAALTGEPATAKLPEPPGVLVVITVGAGALLGAIGGARRARHD